MVFFQGLESELRRSHAIIVLSSFNRGGKSAARRGMERDG